MGQSRGRTTRRSRVSPIRTRKSRPRENPGSARSPTYLISPITPLAQRAQEQYACLTRNAHHIRSFVAEPPRAGPDFDILFAERWLTSNVLIDNHAHYISRRARISSCLPRPGKPGGRYVIRARYSPLPARRRNPDVHPHVARDFGGSSPA